MRDNDNIANNYVILYYKCTNVQYLIIYILFVVLGGGKYDKTWCFG